MPVWGSYRYIIGTLALRDAGNRRNSASLYRCCSDTAMRWFLVCVPPGCLEPEPRIRVDVVPRGCRVFRLANNARRVFFRFRWLPLCCPRRAATVSPVVNFGFYFFAFFFYPLYGSAYWSWSHSKWRLARVSQWLPESMTAPGYPWFSQWLLAIGAATPITAPRRPGATTLTLQSPDDRARWFQKIFSFNIATFRIQIRVF